MSSGGPLVSVVMAVHNSGEHLSEAIESILAQSFKNFEFIIINDGSKDNSASIIKSYKDSRIVYINQQNQGLAKSINNGVAKAKGELIARMDSDDIAYTDRLMKQVEFLQKNKNAALVGTSFDIIDLSNKVVATSYQLSRNEDLQMEFLVRNPFGHGTIMIRKKILEDVGGYDENEPIEDYELWWRVAKKYEVGNIPEKLYGWRLSPAGMSLGSSDKRQDPIIKLIRLIWSNSKLPGFKRQQIQEGLKYYSSLGPEYREQYLHMACAVALSQYKSGHLRLAVRNLARLLFIGGALRAFNNFRRDSFSHYYNLAIIHK